MSSQFSPFSPQNFVLKYESEEKERKKKISYPRPCQKERHFPFLNFLLTIVNKKWEVDPLKGCTFFVRYKFHKRS